ncbi:MAG: cyclic pyranopterin monophosphate synthase MoaC [Sedimentisphaerales bacterium]|nr:cyclic pyranopterin monophosphate synthase MoaC [Sedimentisphaerales bacterium]
MIDISTKDVSVRTAKAKGTIALGENAFEIIKQGTCKKGDVFTTAKIAAIQAVKSTPNLIPMCHPIPIEGIEVDFEQDESEKTVTIAVSVKSTGKTGVEMEASCGAAAGCLTIYDMLKYADKAMIIKDVKLMEKAGGKSGDYKRPD